MSTKTYTVKMKYGTYTDARFVFGQYMEGNTAIQIEDEEGPIGKVTVNLEELPAEGCVWVKDYAENEGLADSLTELGLIEPTGRTARSGFVTVAEYRLKGDWAGADN